MDARKFSWAGKRVLVTGSTRFLGEAVARELLSRDAVVIGLVNEREPGSHFADGQRTDRFHLLRGRADDTFRVHSALAVHEINTVFHLADVSFTQPQSDDRALNAVLRAVKLYDPQAHVITARPSRQLRISNGTQTGSHVPLGIARFGDVFGNQGSEDAQFVPRTIARLLSGETADPVGGPGRDFVFVRDAAAACVLVAEEVHNTRSALDLSFKTGWELSEAELAEKISSVLTGAGIQFENSDASLHPLGWGPRTSLNDAIAESIAYQRKRSSSQAFKLPAPGSSRKAA